MDLWHLEQVVGMRATWVILPCILTGIGGFWAGRLGSGPDSGSAGGKAGTAAANSSHSADGSSSGASKTARSPRGSVEDRPPGGLTSAMKGALGHNLEGKRLERWMALLSTMKPEEAQAIAALLDEERRAGREFKAETTAFWQLWGNKDGKSAWDYVSEHPDIAGREGPEAVLKSWAFADSKAAIAAFTELGDSPLFNAALAGLSHGLAESDPAAAVAFASGLPDGRQIEAAVHVSGSIIHAVGNEGAEAWFDKLPADTPIFNKESARVLMEALSRSDPGSVEEFAMARLDQQWSTRPAEQNFAASMILRNGGSPWDYVATVMEKHPRPEEPFAFTTWVARLNPKSAIEWADANPDNPATDRVLAGVIQVYRQKGATEEAGNLLERIKAPSVRELVEGQ
jgi:hypothetical protein